MILQDYSSQIFVLLLCSILSETIKSSTISPNKQLNYNNNIGSRVIHGGWGPWSSGRCSVTCGEGRRQRTRLCNNPPPLNGGQKCLGLSSILETCRFPGCDPEIGRGDWSPWSSCAGSCGLGTRRRTRTCTSQTQPCFDSQVEACEDKVIIPPCPVDGGWSSWFMFLPCSTKNLEKICQQPNKFHQVEMRFCSEPYPEFGGNDCEGPEYNYTSCAKLTPACNKAFWSAWQPGKCSVTCGTGLEKKFRTCIVNSKSPLSSCFGPSIKTDECRMPACSGWSSWRETKTCIPQSADADPCQILKDDDVRIIERSCHGDVACSGESRRTENCREFFKCGLSSWASKGLSLFTTTLPFFLPTSWSTWELVGSCTVSCGEGLQRRRRICIPETGPGSEKVCPGLSEEMVPCKMPSCSSNPSSEESSMTVSLASFEQSGFSREDEETLLFQQSGDDESDEESGFTSWSQWSHCDTKCLQHRKRKCRQKTSECDGETSETRQCPRGSKEVCWSEGAGALNAASTVITAVSQILPLLLIIFLVFHSSLTG